MTLGEKNFQTFLQRYEEARTTEELDKQTRINIEDLEKATPPISSGGLSKTTKIGVGACVGLLAGVAVALLSELMAP